MEHSNNNCRDGPARIQLCVSEIRGWMNQNMLKLNDDKTQLIVFTSKYKRDLYNDLSITIGGNYYYYYYYYYKTCNSKELPNISLVCKTYKLYERMIQDRIAPTIELHLIKEHAGFRSGKSSTSQLLNII